MFRTLRFARYLFAFILCIPYLHAADVWDSPALTGDPAAIRQAAAAIKAEPDTDATIFLMEMR